MACGCSEYSKQKKAAVTNEPEAVASEQEAQALPEGENSTLVDFFTTTEAQELEKEMVGTFA
jgi:hypothetical protein